MHVLVTGAARGIGAAVVAACRAKQHRVTACDIDASALAGVYAEREGVDCVALDVADAGSWDSVLAEVWARQPVDALINVAGVLRAGVTGELDPADVALQLNVNVRGVIYGTDAAARLMRGRGSGHIVNIGSTSCLFAVPGNGVYSASKHAVRGFTIAAAGDLRSHGLNVSLVCPGAVKTDMLEQQRGDDRAALTFEGKRALDASEVADVIVDHVLVKKPLETYLPGGDQWKGKLCTVLPEVFLSSVEKSREKGIRNFKSPQH
ncbi:SDR family oxidoreductase [Pseudohalioglobus sediminis]|uniref:SDR family oxidoreductase n=1 Tax=Pseudohalioglobus sediminis TaxID=2606449 RepID=A0A5B0WZK3_9GAMM|nr:SDR family oxidoreductase [Pseudohalioglobus sediminis]KAA1192510.1 SDR family oxidoreductase [Pseudohalioglobus sediminis]